MNAQALLKTHLALECTGLTTTGLLLRMAGPCSDDPPRVYVVEQDGSYATYVRQDVPGALRVRLLALAPVVAYHDHSAVFRLLAEDWPSASMWGGKSYVFPDGIGPADYPDVTRLDQEDATLIEEYDPRIDPFRSAVHAVLVDGRIVAACTSSRENEESGEAWVQTLPEYRHRGLGRQVVRAWAHHLQRRGKKPFYSHFYENLASQGLARDLGLIQYLADVAYA